MSRPALRFPISLEIGGAPMTFLGRDMPVGWFFQGFPDVMPMTQCYQRENPDEQQRLVAQLEAWHDQILCRGVWVATEGTACRRLTPELVQRLGDQREAAVVAYMSGIGWITEHDKGYTVSAAALPRGLHCEDPLADAERRAAMTRIPGRNLLAGILAVAKYAHTATHVIWRRWWISEFIWTWHLMPPLGGRSAPAPSRLPEDFAHIGIEA